MSKVETHRERLENIGKEQTQNTKFRFDALTKMQFLAYGVGHFVNDVSSACWFNYLLYYLEEVVRVKFGPYSILSGQIADALATPFVGFLSDRTNTKIGKRIPWYIGGYIVLLLTFVPMWSGCLLCDMFYDSEQVQIFYYIFFPAIFNFGWASLQISHMSLVPSLSCGRSRRDGLNSLRNTFSFLAILFVYCVALLLFNIVEDPKQQFKYLSQISMGAGSITTIFFMIQINEPILTKKCSIIADALSKQLTTTVTQRVVNLRLQDTLSDITGVTQNETSEPNFDFFNKVIPQEPVVQPYTDVKSESLDNSFYQGSATDNLNQVVANRVSIADEIFDWRQWFREFQFYRYGLVYMGVRLYCNVSSTMITFYLITVLEFQQEHSIKTPIEIALIPLSLYLMSAITSASLDKFYKKFGKKWTFTVGALLCGGTSASLIFLTPETKNYMYAVAPIIGIAQAINLNTGITLISDVIGLRGSSGAFVFGFYSFLDKISTGVVLFLCTNAASFKDPNYVRWVMIVVPSISCMFAWILVVIPVAQVKEDCLVQDTNQTSLNGKKRQVCLKDELVT